MSHHKFIFVAFLCAKEGDLYGQFNYGEVRWAGYKTSRPLIWKIFQPRGQSQPEVVNIKAELQQALI